MVEPFVRCCEAAGMGEVRMAVDGGTTTGRAGEPTENEGQPSGDPLSACDGRCLGTWMPGRGRCALASTNCQPRRLSQNQSCEKIQGIGRIPFCRRRVRDVVDVPAGSRGSAHDEEASPCDPHAGPSAELQGVGGLL